VLKCFFPSWIAAWFVAIFLPSTVIAYLGLSEQAAALGSGFDNILATTWKVADDVGPFAKLSFGAALLIMLFAVPRARLSEPIFYAVSVVCGVVAMLAALVWLPAEQSRGFGIGLTGARFHRGLMLIYFVGGALAGAAFAFAMRRCAKRG